MPVFEDVVRPFQSPTDASAELYQPQTGQTSQQPVLITCGMGAGVGGIKSFTSTYSVTITSYMDMSLVEQATS
jgi:hypothetical protein